MVDEILDVEVGDLATDEIRELLVEAGAEIGEDEAEQIARFVRDAGGLEEALAALGELAERRDAAMDS